MTKNKKRILESIARLEPLAYGATINIDIGRRGNRLPYAILYDNINALEQAGLIRTRKGYRPNRSNRLEARYCYLTKEGKKFVSRLAICIK